MEYTLMHKSIPVLDIDLDEDIGDVLLGKASKTTGFDFRPRTTPQTAS